MKVAVAKELLARVAAHAAASPDAEICGLLLGSAPDRIDALLPAVNVAPDPARRFEVDPATLFAALRSERAGGPRVLGHYHSHPDGVAIPSARDAEAAVAAGALWLIVGRGEAGLWRATPGGKALGAFEPVEIADAPVALSPSSRHKDRANEGSEGRMMADGIDFASLLCSRLCHDMLSPVGALNNGIELLADETDPEMRARCLDLLAESARASANKLKFFRLAFGAAGGFGDSIDTREVRGAIEGLFGGDRRIQVGWMVAEGALAKGTIKILLNLALIAGDALVRGGRLDIGAEAGASRTEIVVRAEGGRIVLDPELKAALAGETPADALTPRAAAAWLVWKLADDKGGAIHVSDGEDGVLILGAELPGTG